MELSTDKAILLVALQTQLKRTLAIAQDSGVGPTAQVSVPMLLSQMESLIMLLDDQVIR